MTAKPPEQNGRPNHDVKGRFTKGNSAWKGEQPEPEPSAPQANNAVKHGFYPFLQRGSYPPCNKCAFKEECDLYLRDSHCRLFERIESEETEAIMALPHIRPEHRALVTLYIRNHALCRVIDAYCSKVSPFRGSGKRRSLDVQAILRVRWTAENAATRQAEILGLTPSSRERLRLPTSRVDQHTIVVDGTKAEYIAALRAARAYLDPEPPAGTRVQLMLPAHDEERREDGGEG